MELADPLEFARGEGAGLAIERRTTPPPVVKSCPYMALAGWVGTLAVADVLGSVLIAAAVFHVYADPLQYRRWQLWEGIAGFLVAWALTAYVESLYAKRTLLSGLRNQVTAAAASCVMAFGLLLLLGFMLQLIGGVSRVWLFTWSLCVLGWVNLLRLAWCLYMRRRVRLGTCVDRALVVSGSSALAGILSDEIQYQSGGRIGIVSAVSVPGTSDGPSIDWVENAVKDGNVDRVIVASARNAVPQAQALIDRLSRVAVDVSLIPDLDGLSARIVGVDRIGSLPTIELVSRPLTAIEVALKRAEDLVFASVILLAVSPLLALTAIAIKLDSRGPVFFRQIREGHHDRKFRLWKFRTMYESSSDFGALRQTSRSDDRVTRVGYYLRRFSIDELPQLLNVIRGDMSIVGPRPHALGMTSLGLTMTQVLNEYPARHRLKPGITGWAQVNGCRGEIDSHEKLRRRVALDCFYIDNWSLWLDAWIVLRTIALIVINSDAY